MKVMVLHEEMALRAAAVVEAVLNDPSAVDFDAIGTAGRGRVITDPDVVAEVRRITGFTPKVLLQSHGR